MTRKDIKRSGYWWRCKTCKRLVTLAGMWHHITKTHKVSTLIDPRKIGGYFEGGKDYE